MNFKDYLMKEDEFTDKSLISLKIIKLKRKIKELETNSKVHPLKKQVMISDYNKRIDALRKEAENYGKGKE